MGDRFFKPVKHVQVSPRVQLQDTGWMTDEPEFESRLSKTCSLLHVIQTGSEAHPASYPMGTDGSFSGSKVAEA
jgi:hypothetical protein